MKYLALLNVPEGAFFTLSRNGKRLQRVGWPEKPYPHHQPIYYGQIRCRYEDGSEAILSSRCKIENIMNPKQTKPRRRPDPRLGKGHAHKSKKDYDRKRVKSSDEWGDHLPTPHIKIYDLTDKTGSIK